MDGWSNRNGETGRDRADCEANAYGLDPVGGRPNGEVNGIVETGRTCWAADWCIVGALAYGTEGELMGVLDTFALDARWDWRRASNSFPFRSLLAVLFSLLAFVFSMRPSHGIDVAGLLTRLLFFGGPLRSSLPPAPPLVEPPAPRFMRASRRRTSATARFSRSCQGAEIWPLKRGAAAMLVLKNARTKVKAARSCHMVYGNAV